MNTTKTSATPISSEIYRRFRSLGEWQIWASTHGYIFSQDHAQGLLRHIREHGFVEPLTKTARRPGDILVSGDNYRDTIRSGALTSRHRAVLFEWQRIASNGQPQLNSRGCKVYAPEGLTEFALFLRGLFPKFIGSEYAQTGEERQLLFPIPSEDLQALSFPTGVFDLVISNEVFEHLPDLDRALREIARVLNSSGALIATFPFLFKRERGIVKARLAGDRLEHLTEPEYHGNPLRPEEGSLVFELPGWDILERARAAGFGDAYISFIASARHGVLAKDVGGVLVFVARKQASEVEGPGPG